MVTTDAEVIRNLKAHMKRLADHNDDEWKVTITQDETGFTIEIVELADRHTLTEGRGPDLPKAIENLYAELPKALESWGYENIK